MILRVYLRYGRQVLKRNGWSVAAGALAGASVAILLRLAADQSAGMILLVLAVALLGAYYYSRHQARVNLYLKSGFIRLKASLKFKARERSVGEEPEIGLPPESPQLMEFQVLHGSIRQFNSLVETQAPEELVARLNDYFSIVRARVVSRQGRFERFAGSSFIAYWQDPTHALLCALELRKDFASLNESFRVDGQKTFSFGMGLATGNALSARIGASSDLRPSILGEVVAMARALDQLSAVVGQDILVSGDLWRKVEDRFFGELLGEAKLTNETGLMEYRSLTGYWDPQGRPVQVDSPYMSSPSAPAESTRVQVLVPTRKAVRWLINNGSQIVGPFTPEEIAARLFAQELDFDCECWQEGTGSSAQIRNSGIFGSTHDASSGTSSCYWVFDGETAHGPVSVGFLRTAIERGLIPPDSYLCQDSTVQGWQPLSAWISANGQDESAETAPTKAA